MDNQTLKNELLKYIDGGQDIESISFDLEYMLSPENALFIIAENLTGDDKMRQAIDDLLQDINYHSFSRALDDLTAAWDRTYPKNPQKGA